MSARYRTLFELCETELPGDEKYGYIGGLEKYRQHQAFYVYNGLHDELDAWYDMVGRWLYIRDYLKAIGLTSTLDTTSFSCEDLIKASMKVEKVNHSVKPSFESCKNVLNDLLHEWNGCKVVLGKRGGKYHNLKMYQLKPHTSLNNIESPPVNSIVRLNPLSEQSEVIFPSPNSSWMIPPFGAIDAYRQHHDIMKTF